MLLVSFEKPDRAVTPGQYLALFKGDECMGGGPILSGGVTKSGSVRENISAS